MSNILGKLEWSIRHRGLAKTLQAAARSLVGEMHSQTALPRHPFDVEHDTDTGGLIAGGDLITGHANDRFIAGYAAVPVSRFRSLIARWQASDPPPALADYTLVDLGCGKGRAILLASELGFREVVGVELNPALAALARANMERWIAAGKAHCAIRVEQADVMEFEWPASSCVVFLFNPFGLGLMQRVADRMAAVFRDRPSELEVLYYKPEQAAAFANQFEMIWCQTTGISAEDLAVDPVAGANDETRAYRLIRRET